MSTTLDEWIKQEAEILAANKRGCGSGFCTPQQLEGKSGLEILRAMMDGSLPVPYSARHEGILPVEVGEGFAIFQGKPEIQHLNPAGTVHGGWMANLADSAMGSAVLSLLPKNKTIYVTNWINVTYLKAMPRDVGRVQCRADVRCQDSATRTMTVDASIRGVDGRAYAVAEGVYNVVRGAFP